MDMFVLFLSSVFTILTMHVMSHDVKEQFNDPRHQKTKSTAISGT